MNFKFKIGDKAFIKEIDILGTVKSVWITEKGTQFEIRYFLNGKPETIYFFEDELLEKETQHEQIKRTSVLSALALS